MSLITDKSTANTKSKDDRPKFGAAMTIQERKHEVINWKLNKIKNLPAFVKSELARNPDGDNKTARRKKENERAQALAKSVDTRNSGTKFSIDMDAFVSSIAKEDYERRFNG